jgi:hypothetical protein
MPWVEFEPMIPVFERVKTFHALDRAATVIGCVLATAGKRCVCAKLRVTPALPPVKEPPVPVV